MGRKDKYKEIATYVAQEMLGTIDVIEKVIIALKHANIVFPLFVMGIIEVATLASGVVRK